MRKIAVLSAAVFGLLPAWVLASELVHTTATLSQARGELAATSVGNLALFAGGKTGAGYTGYSTRVDIYDTGTGTWSTSALSEARGHIAATSVGDYALFAGGYSWKHYVIGGWEKDETTKVDIYNVGTGLWSATTLSQSVSAATAVGTQALFAAPYSTVVNVFDADTGLWSTAALSQPRTSVVATTVGQIALFAGPVAGPGGGVVVDMYDNQSHTWSTDVIPGAQSLSPVATSCGTKALFADEDAAYVYDSALGQWSYDDRLSEHGEEFAATSIGDMALFGGGGQWSPVLIDLNGDGIITADELDVVRSHWGETVTPGDKWNGDLTGDGFVGADDLDLVRAFWGCVGIYDFYDALDVYDGATDTWSVDALSAARRSLAATTVGNVALFGGGYGSGGGSNVVDIYALLPAPPGAIPEPGTGCLLVLGALTLVLLRRGASKAT